MLYGTLTIFQGTNFNFWYQLVEMLLIRTPPSGLVIKSCLYLYVWHSELKLLTLSFLCLEMVKWRSPHPHPSSLTQSNQFLSVFFQYWILVGKEGCSDHIKELSLIFHSHSFTRLCFQSHLTETKPEDERGIVCADFLSQTRRNVSEDTICFWWGL